MFLRLGGERGMGDRDGRGGILCVSDCWNTACWKARNRRISERMASMKRCLLQDAGADGSGAGA